MREDLGFGDAQLKVEHVQELALDAAHVALVEEAGAERPVHVLERGVVEVLCYVIIILRAWSEAGHRTYFIRADERSEEDSLAGPLLERELEVGSGTVEVDEGAEEDRQLHAGALDDGPCERGELGVHGAAGLWGHRGRLVGPGGGRGAAEREVNHVDHALDDVFCNKKTKQNRHRMRSSLPRPPERSACYSPMNVRDNSVLSNSTISGECSAGSTRLAPSMRPVTEGFMGAMAVGAHAGNGGHSWAVGRDTRVCAAAAQPRSCVREGRGGWV